MRVHQHDISDVLKYLPDLKQFDKSRFGSLGCSAFICTLGFEDRTSWIIKELAQDGLLRNAVQILICYPTNEDENAEHLADFEAAALAMRGFKKIRYSRDTFAGELSSALGDLDPGATVIFDVSTCASYVFYPAMKDLLYRDVELHVTYAEAKLYYPIQSEWLEVAARADEEGSLFIKSFEEADFQSLGVEDVYPYSIFSEMNCGNRASSLIAVPNFSALRMRSIITRDRELNKTAFRNVVWILGEPPNQENRWRIEAIKRTNDVGDNVKDENLLFASTLDYKDMIGTLEEVWLRRRHSFHMSIGSLGSKMQHLGTFFFLVLHQEIGIWLAEPRRFQAKRFSEGVNGAWQVEFGCVDKLRENLALYMTFGW